MKSVIYRRLWIYERLNAGHHLGGRKAFFFFFKKKVVVGRNSVTLFHVSVLLQSRLNFPRHDFEDKNASRALCQQIMSLLKTVTPCKKNVAGEIKMLFKIIPFKNISFLSDSNSLVGF